MGEGADLVSFFSGLKVGSAEGRSSTDEMGFDTLVAAKPFQQAQGIDGAGGTGDPNNNSAKGFFGASLFRFQNSLLRAGLCHGP